MPNFVKQMFSDKKGRLKSSIGSLEIDERYNEYISILAQVHEGIKNHVNDLTMMCSETDIPKIISLKLPLSSEDDGETTGKFADKLESNDPFMVCEVMLRESKLIAGYIYQAFMQLRNIIVKHPRKSCKYFRRIYEDRLMERYGEFIVREIYRKWEFDICGFENSKKLHKMTAKSMRKSPYFKNLEMLPIQEESLFPIARLHPIVFEQIYFCESQVKLENPRIEIENLHVIVLVHGFQGNSYDLKIIKNYIGMVYPKCFFLESNANEMKTDGDIQEMGFRLSRELIQYLSE